MRVAPEIVAGLCRARSRDLLTMAFGELSSVDPVRLLWAIAGVESSFGRDSYPRHENAYCYNGRYFNPQVTAEVGCLAHCSYGPWQVMYANFPAGVDPRALLPFNEGRIAAELSIRAAIAVLNKAIVRNARSLVDLVTHYNGPDDVPEYSRRLFAAMDRPMPQDVGTVAV